MKLWNRHDEWTQYANCGDSIGHILPPHRDDGGPVADVPVVQAICEGCRVRPECIKWATDPNKPESSVWVAGRWIPGGKRQARRVRAELLASLSNEYEARGDDV